jgi:hypothetical protein
MHAVWICSAFVVLALPTSHCLGDEKPDPPPGGIRLIKGYTHKTLQGIDTRVGRISKKGGVTINYDIGHLAGNYAVMESKRAQWFRERRVAGEIVQIAFSKKGKVYITFPRANANFDANIKTPTEMADVLLMVLTFRDKKKTKKNGG